MLKFITKSEKVGVRPTQIGAALTAQKRIYRAVAFGAKVLVAMTVWMTVVAAHVHAQTTITLTNGQTYSSSINVVGMLTITIASGTATISGQITGSGYIYKYGNGKVIVTNNSNSLNGQLVIGAGTWQIGNGTNGVFVPGLGVNINSTSAILRFEPGANMTFANVISGTGKLEYQGTATKKLTLTAVNTYEGTTTVLDGILQIGNGSAGSIAYTSKVTLTANSSVLRFEPGANMTFSKVIEGAGKVEYKGTTSKTLTFTGENTYTGTTTIEANSDFYIGNGGATGRVQGNIINNGDLTFHRSGEYTYSKVISGGGHVYQWSSGKTILTGVNTYTGPTYVTAGTLQIGNGASGSINNTSLVYLNNANCTLRFEPGADMTFSKVISGSGKVEYKGTGSTKLYFTGENTYTGTTTIEAGSDFYIGNGGATGRVQGNIIINSGSALMFNRSGEYTYSKVISGGGVVWQYGTGKTILTGVNTYTGSTAVVHGTLQIGNGASGSINTSVVDFVNSNCTLRFEPGAEMTFAKRITGPGNVEYKGTATKKLILTATDNSCTGSFTLESGSLEIVKWAGAFTQAAGTTLDIKNNVSLGSSSGAVTLQGGDIYMNLTTSPPSKLTAVGAIAASGTTTLHVTTDDVTNQTIIQAASGLGSAAPFALDMPGYTASLTATGTQLQLTATTTDAIPPLPGAGVNGTAAYNTANLSWSAATDNETPPENLRYYVYQSASNNITTVANCETNGTLLNDGGSINITAYDVTALTPQTTYYFNVVVADMTNNKAAYIPKELTTGVEPTIVSLTISPETATVQPGGTQQFTATVVTVGGADESVTWSVSGNYSTLTTITADGLLTVGSNETAESFTVRVISDFDPTFSAEATANVVVAKIVSLDISPKTATVQPGGTQQFTATVNAVNGADESVTWSLRGNLSTLTTVSATGLLTVGSNETATTLIVNVASVFDPTVSDEATVNVGNVGIAPPSPDEGGGVRVYPNPTSGELRVESGEWRVESVEIFDVMGRTVLTTRTVAPDGTHQLQIGASAPAGVYFLRITTETGVVVRKVVKQ